MAFPPQFLDELRARLPLAERIGRKVRLVRRGREYVGLCPFHNEKTPSFTVVEDKGFFHCFGCGTHGDIIGFVMRTENIEFLEAVERLAHEAGLELPRSGRARPESARANRSLEAALEGAAHWFEAELSGAAGRAARDYLAGRGLDAEIIARFRLGFAPDGRTGLRSALRAQGFADEVLVGAGLLVQPEDPEQEPYDRFRKRILFPITDKRGHIVAFGGRALGEGEPKYLNSPETPLFHKGALLYGLPLALERARKKRAIVVVEGYMDVIALHRVGISNAVAPLGTALTEHQMEELWRLSPEPVVCFDGDTAGARAAQRAAERALPRLKPGRSLKVAFLPEGTDPDDLVREGGAARIRAILIEARPLSEVLWEAAVREGGLDTPERQAGVIAALERAIEPIADRTLRGSYARYFRNRLWEATRRVSARGRAPASPRVRAIEKLDRRRHANPAGDRERALLQTILGFPSLIPEFAEEIGRLKLETLRFRLLRDALLDAPPVEDAAALSAHLCAEPALAALVEELCGEGALVLNWAARPESASLADARIQLRHLLDFCQRVGELETFKRETEATFAAEPSERNLARFVEAIRLLEQAPGFEAELPDYGRASGRRQP